MTFKIKTLKDFVLKDKFVLLRSDLNSEFLSGKIIPSQRIKESSETIKFLKKNKAKVVVIAHQGNPGKKDFFDLRQHARVLNKFTKIKFVRDICGEKAIKELKNLKSGEAILLDNIRSVGDEFYPEKKNNVLLKNLGSRFDLYVNDAFSVSHRNHTSITSFPKKIPSCIGPLVEKELEALKKISIKNCLYVLGGAKLESNIKLLGKNKVLAGGLFSQVCLVSKGYDLGYQNKFLKKTTLVKGKYSEFLKNLRKKLKNVVLPEDFAVKLRTGKRKEFDLKDFPLEYEIEDIGEKTLKKYIKEIKKAKAVYMKGPFGFTEEKKFSKGTVELLRAIADSKAFTLIGGGSLNETINKYKIPVKKFNHVSLSGGALSNYIAGEKLPGLEVLGYYKN